MAISVQAVVFFKKEGHLLPDMRSWKERQRLDFRERDRPGYKRPDAGKKRDRRGYKRPDAGKRPKTHRGATGSSISRKKRGNKQSTGRATHNQNIGFGAGPTFDTHPVNQKETAIQYRQKTFSVGFRDKNNNISASEELRYSAEQHNWNAGLNQTLEGCTK